MTATKNWHHLAESFEIAWDHEVHRCALSDAVNILSTDPKRAISDLENLVSKGSALGLYYLGHTYLRGPIEFRNDELGKELWQRAANMGVIEASLQLVSVYKYEGTYQSAVSELEKLSEQEFSPATFSLGRMYYLGEGVERDFDKALKYWRKAEIEGHLNARRWHSIVLRRGELGAMGTLSGYLKMLGLIAPFVAYGLRHPHGGDRLRYV